MKLSKISNFKFKPKPPYSFELTVRKPAGWSWFTPRERWEKGTIWSGFWFDAMPGGKTRKVPVGVKARSEGNAVSVDVYCSLKPAKNDILRLKGLLSKSLGIDEDIRPLYKLMARHRVLKTLVRRLYGMREGWGMNIFSSLTLAILLQMAPIKRSEYMWECLLKNYGTRISFDGKPVVIWPNEEKVSKLNPRELAARCKMGYRSKFLVKLAKQLAAGFPTIEELSKMTSEEAAAKLMELYGVGEYTAGFASPHPSFSLDVWSIKIFYPIIFGKRAPANDPRSVIKKAGAAAEKLWGDWRGYVLAYVLNDLPYLAKKFNVPVE